MYQGLTLVVLLPAVVVVKSARIILRMCSSGPVNVVHFLYCLPMFFLGLFSWARGFAAGCFEADVGS